MLSWILESMAHWLAILPLMVAFVVAWTLFVLIHDIYASWREYRAEKKVKEMNE